MIPVALGAALSVREAVGKSAGSWWAEFRQHATVSAAKCQIDPLWSFATDRFLEAPKEVACRAKFFRAPLCKLLLPDLLERIPRGDPDH